MSDSVWSTKSRSNLPVEWLMEICKPQLYLKDELKMKWTKNGRRERESQRKSKLSKEKVKNRLGPQYLILVQFASNSCRLALRRPEWTTKNLWNPNETSNPDIAFCGNKKVLPDHLQQPRLTKQWQSLTMRLTTKVWGMQEQTRAPLSSRDLLAINSHQVGSNQNKEVSTLCHVWTETTPQERTQGLSSCIKLGAQSKGAKTKVCIPMWNSRTRLLLTTRLKMPYLRSCRRLRKLLRRLRSWVARRRVRRWGDLGRLIGKGRSRG